MRLEVFDTETSYGDGAIRVLTPEARPLDPADYVIMFGTALEVLDDGNPSRCFCQRIKCQRCTTPDCPGMRNPNPPPPPPPPGANMGFRRANTQFTATQILFSEPTLGPAVVIKYSGETPPTMSDASGLLFAQLSAIGEPFDEALVFHMYVVTAGIQNPINEQQTLDKTIVAIPVRRFTPTDGFNPDPG
jgi:hypothetical protein